VTATVIPDTGQASVAATALGLVQGSASTPVGVGSPRTQAAAGLPTASFSALLLGLRAEGGTDAKSTAAEFALPLSGPSLEDTAPSASLLFGNPVSSATASPAPAVAATTRPDGEVLPPDGSDLPLPDVETLLASLAAPAIAAQPAQPGMATATLPESAPAPGPPGPVAGPIQGGDLAPGQSTAASGQTDSLAATMLPAADTAEGGTPGENMEADLPAAEAAGDPAGRRPSGVGAEFAVMMDARARLDAAPEPAPRIVAGPETTASAMALPTSATGTTAASAPPGSATQVLPFDTLPALEPLAYRETWAQGLGDRLMMMAERGMQSATLRLQPEHLGPLEVRIQVDEDGSAKVLFSAHQATTREALEQAIPRLRELFADQGLNLMQANVDSGRDGFTQRGFAATASAWRGALYDDPEIAAPEAVSLWQMRPAADRRIDVFV
jgi:hypothetical protein